MRDAILKIGETVDLFTGSGPSYRTKVEDATKDGHIIISAPIYRGIPIVLIREQEAELYYYRTNGRFCVDIKVVDLKRVKNLRLMTLEIIGEPRRQQRRESFRLSVKRDVWIRSYDQGPFPEDYRNDEEELFEKAKLDDISETGSAFFTANKYECGDKIYALIFLKWPVDNAEPIGIMCEIVQAKYDATKNNYRLGVKFLEMSEYTRGHIAKFVLVEQQKKIKHQRWLKEQGR